MQIPSDSFAVVMHKPGGPDVLQYQSVKTPKPGAGEVLVKVKAASVNHTDLFHREGQFHIQKPLPHVLGMDVAGDIAAIGEDVDGWPKGQRVVATFEDLGKKINGAYAQYTVVPAEKLHVIPSGLDYVGAVSAGLAFSTAWASLFYTGEIKETDRVLIHAASSGVGTAAIQIASWVGAQVFAVTTPNKTEALRQLGADFVLDRTNESLAETVNEVTAGVGIDLVLDLVGKSTLQSSIDVLAKRGRVVSVGALSGEQANINVMDLIMKNASVRGCFEVIRREDFDSILRLFAEGTFKPMIDSVLPLKEARRAHERIEAKMVSGKIVLVPETTAPV